MSLADKLNYLRTTKGLIKTAINNKGGTLTDDSSFRSYADEIDNIGSTMTATADDIVAGKTAISNGGMITGTSTYNMTNNGVIPFSAVGSNANIIGASITKIDLTNVTLESNVTNLTGLFRACRCLTEIVGFFNTSAVTNMYQMFSGCIHLTSVPTFSTVSATNMQEIFGYCAELLSVPELDLSVCTTLYEAFRGCNKLPSISITNANRVTNLQNAFYECKELNSVLNFGTSQPTNMNSTFYNCLKLVTAPTVDTSNLTALGNTFNGCTALTNVPQYNTGRMTSLSNAFANCPNLSNDSLNNILAMCTNSNVTNTNYKKLSFVGLSSAQATVCQGLSNYQDFINAGWITGY